MKKICFVTTVPGTIEAFLIDLSAYLHSEGNYEITFISGDNEKFRDVLPDYIRYIPIKMKRGVNLSGIHSVNILRDIFKQEHFDIVQYSTPNAAFYASIASKIAGIRNRIYCQWGIRYMGFKGFNRQIFKIIEKVTCTNSTKIEPESFGILKFSVNEGLYKSEKAEVIWNGSACGIDLSKFDINMKEQWNSEIRKRYGIEKHEVLIGFAGRLTKDKGFNELIAAFQKLSLKKDCKMIIIGPMDNEKTLDKKLVLWAKQSGKVIFTGRVNDINKYFAALDIFVSPSYREGFGIVLIEAQAMEIPVIATDVPGQIDAILPNKTGLAVKVKDIDSLREAIEQLVYDDAKRNLMRKEARIFVAGSFEQKKLFSYILQKREQLISNG